MTPGASTRVLVIGGGPAGSTAATLLARQGFEVTLLEAERFPRYHIGESILPSCLPILDLLGARDKIEAHGFVRKGGAYFEWGPEQWELNFDHLRDANAYSYQVVRSEFDQLLLEHARSQGVQVCEGVCAQQVEFDGERAARIRWSPTHDRLSGGTTSFDFLVDASGRAGLLANGRLKSRRFHQAFQNVALWAYWRGARKLDRGPAGAIAVCSVPNGWFWAIPLHDGTTSVGLVISKAGFAESRTRLGGVAEVYAHHLAECPRIAELVEPAERVSDFKAEQDYSYVSDRFAGPGFVLAGDAACFLDPLLSTGVHLATFSGMLAAASIGSLLRGEVTETPALDFYGRAYRQAYERLLILVSLFYRSYRREAQFFEADKLTRRERHLLQLYESFLHIVSGVEDLADARDSALDIVASRLLLSGTPAAAAGDLMQVPTSPENAVAGLYLVTEPVLGLRRQQTQPVTAS